MAPVRKEIVKTLKLAVRNIGRHPVKNMLVGLVILLAANVFLLTGSLAENARQNWRAFLAATFVGNGNLTAYQGKEKDFSLPALTLPAPLLSPPIYAKLEELGVYYTKRIKIGAIVYNEEKGELAGTPVTLVGVDWPVEEKHLNNLQLVAGEVRPDLAEGVLVWEELATYYQWRVGEELTLFVKDIDGNTLPFTFIITGVLKNKTGEALAGTGSFPLFPFVFASYEYLGLLLGLEEDAATDLAIWDGPPAAETALKRLARRHGLQFFHGEHGFEVIWGIIEFIYFIGVFLELFILVVLIVTSFNLNLIGFAERRKEIGTMYALGAKPRWIAGLLLAELVIFAVTAFGCSLLVYFLLSLVTSHGLTLGAGLGLAFAGAKIHLQLVPATAGVAFLAIVGTMLVSSSYPVYLTTKINPVAVFNEAER